MRPQLCIRSVCISTARCYTLIAKFAPISLHITPTRAKTQAVSYPAIPTLGKVGKHECAWIVLGAVLGLLKTPHCTVVVRVPVSCSPPSHPGH